MIGQTAGQHKGQGHHKQYHLKYPVNVNICLTFEVGTTSLGFSIHFYKFIKILKWGQTDRKNEQRQNTLNFTYKSLHLLRTTCYGACSILKITPDTVL